MSENQKWVKWAINTFIALIAAGGGALAWKELVFEEPYFQRLKTHISRGGQIEIVFDDNPDDRRCGVADQDTWIGYLKAGERYTVQYNPSTTRWLTRGPNQAYEGCPPDTSSDDPSKYKLPFSESSTTINLWSGEFTFDEKGIVFQGDVRVGVINNPF